MSEAELYGPIKLFLEAQGYVVKGEIGACDVMAVKDNEGPVVVEPEPYRPRTRPSRRERLLKEFAERVGDPEDGGSDQPQHSETESPTRSTFPCSVTATRVFIARW